MILRSFAGARHVLTAVAVTLLGTSSADAAVFSCRDAASGATLFMYGQLDAAAYQMNEKLASSLRKQGARPSKFPEWAVSVLQTPPHSLRRFEMASRFDLRINWDHRKPFA